ncbi:hypothetical protein [Pedobacter faecalis]|uniref:hypothetical protein n=1 Tax=Pedobacter faecalis TaxID=3041495 RepID=UPI00254D0248|nr:hypothetical protein [Pedobacter sp. ELA7]
MFYRNTLRSKKEYDGMIALMVRERELIKADRAKFRQDITKLKHQLKSSQEAFKNYEQEIQKRNNTIVGMSKHYESQSALSTHQKNIEIQGLINRYDALVHDYVKARIESLEHKLPGFEGNEQTLIDIAEMKEQKKKKEISAIEYLDRLKIILDSIQRKLA